MEITVTQEMIEQAFSNVNNKLAKGKQKNRVYKPNSNENQYYINNLVGELGELVFAKAVVQHGHKLGINPDLFGVFMNSDVCDFYGSKTARTIDVKTIYKKNSDSLIINRQVSNWRKIDSYVLVKLTTEEEINNPMSIYKVNKANVLGSLSFETINKYENLRTMYGDEVFFINKDRLTPIEKLIEFHFVKKDEKQQRYYSEGILKLDLASIEQGAVKECEYKDDINKLADRYRNKKKKPGHYNFIPMFVGNQIASFSMHKGILHTPLLLKAILKAEVKARTQRKLLVIPSYIESYIPKNDKEKLIEIIDNLKCNVEYIWSHNIDY